MTKGVRLNDAGIPHYMGLTGKPLSIAVSIVATTGFLLFGYDRKSTSQHIISTIGRKR